MREEELDEAFEVAKFGIEVERFLSTPIGKYLVERAEREGDEAIKAMKQVDPSNESEVRKVQDGLTIPDKVVSWLAEAIGEGHACEYQLHESE